MSAAAGLLRPALEKLDARIAVSENARSMMVQHIGGEAVVIPNGLYTSRFAGRVRPEWQGIDGTISFLGRMDEPRKGLAVLLAAVPRLVAERPGLKVLVAGTGQADEARRSLPADCRENVLFLGAIDDEARADMLAGSDIYVAPHLGGESFGIVLLEAMAAGAPVLASDLAAFRQVLDGGRLGELFEPGNSDALAAQASRLLSSPDELDKLREAGRVAVLRYDWGDGLGGQPVEGLDGLADLVEIPVAPVAQREVVDEPLLRVGVELAFEESRHLLHELLAIQLGHGFASCV
jgi:phosphatidylinositol alpha-mannosyltransferase